MGSLECVLGGKYIVLIYTGRSIYSGWCIPVYTSSTETQLHAMCEHSISSARHAPEIMDARNKPEGTACSMDADC